MSSGPAHYCLAEDLLDVANTYEKDGAPQTAAARRAEAGVHATLALAAATGLSGRSLEDYEAWRQVASATANAAWEG